MLPDSHHGAFVGENRLWFQDPIIPLKSPARVEIEAREVRYRWEYEGREQLGRLVVDGPTTSLGAEWSDTWHASDGMVLHGTFTSRVLRLFGIYPAGNGPAWGWRIELELNDPEGVRFRMFNVPPDGDEVLAVDLAAIPA